MDVGAPPSEDSEGVTEGPPNSPTGASASDSEDTSAASASASSADCASISKFQVLLLRYDVHADSIMYTLVPVGTHEPYYIHGMRYSILIAAFLFCFFSHVPFPFSFFHSSFVSLSLSLFPPYTTQTKPNDTTQSQIITITQHS